jgi:hypothetical protein
VKRRLLLCAAVIVSSLSCGGVFIQPPRNLFRPSDIVVVSDPSVLTDTSPEFAFLLDTDKAQLVLVDTVNGVLIDLHRDIPGFNGVFLGGQPTAVAAQDDGKVVVVANYGRGVLQVVCTPIASDCRTPQIVREIPVGDGPERVAMLGTHAFATRPYAGVVVEVDTSTGQLVGTYAVGGTPRGIGVMPQGKNLPDAMNNTSPTSPLLPEDRVYVANSGLPVIHRITPSTKAVTAISTGFPTSKIFIAPNPLWVYALRDDRGSLLVVDPRNDTLINTHPNGPADAGPDIALLVPITGIAFQSFTTNDNAAVGVGQFGYVSATDGLLYVINSSGDQAHELNDRVPPDDPQVTTAPTLTQGATPLAITAQTPVLLNYAIAPNYGINLTDKKRVVRTEAWGVTYEGPIPAAAPSRGTIEPGGILTNLDVNFQTLVIPAMPGTTPETMVQPGDFVILLDAPRPSVAADYCKNVELKSDGSIRRWAVSFIPGKPSSLQLSQPPADMASDPLPADILEKCYASGDFLYAVRVAGKWAVEGTASGFYGRAPECPNGLADCSMYQYKSVFFALTIQAGTSPSVTDYRWGFSTSDGVNYTSISLTTSSFLPPGLPRAVAASHHAARHVFVVDEGDEALAFVDASQLTLLSTLR